MPVLFEAGDPEFEPEKPDPTIARIKRGRQLITIGVLLLVLGIAVCVLFIFLVVVVVPASASSQGRQADGTSSKVTTINKAEFGTTSDGTKVDSYTLTNDWEMSVTVITYGARVVSVVVPDSRGNTADVLLGCNSVPECEKTYFGGVIGRVAGRIADASFTLNGQVYRVTANDGRNFINGGNQGWDKRMWSANVDGGKVVMSYTSADGEEGFPGIVHVNVTYELTDNNKLAITCAAITPCTGTPFGVTNELFFNLAGEGSGDIYNHMVQILARRYLPVTTDHLPTGQILSVNGSVYNLQPGATLASVINTVSDDGDVNGFDVTYCLSGLTGRQLAARVSDAQSGRVMTVITNQPAVHLNTGNYLDFVGKYGHHYQRHSGFAVSAMNYPDAVHHENFPGSVLTKWSTYEYEVTYAFTTV